MNFQKYTNTDEFIIEAVKNIEAFIVEQHQNKKILRIALSGGSSPILVYRKLAESKQINWSRIALFLVDERYTSLSSNDSNYKMIRENLTDHVKNLRKFYHYNTRDSIPTIVDQYQKVLQQFESPLFDLVILGLGADGHTASLFPHDSVLTEEKRLVMHTVTAEHAVADRLTLTFPAILDSTKIIFLIRGKSKEGTISNLLNGPASIDELPAKGVLSHDDIDVFYDCND